MLQPERFTASFSGALFLTMEDAITGLNRMGLLILHGSLIIIEIFRIPV